SSQGKGIRLCPPFHGCLKVPSGYTGCWAADELAQTMGLVPSLTLGFFDDGQKRTRPVATTMTDTRQVPGSREAALTSHFFPTPDSCPACSARARRHGRCLNDFPFGEIATRP